MISVIIPAKKEATTIGFLVKETQKYADELIVVLNSQDLETAKNVPEGARIVFEDRAGKGVAMRTGANDAKGEILVFIDADLSHNPHDIPRIVEPIINDDADQVVASRMLGGSSELFYNLPQFVRLCGSHVITLCINRKFNVRLTDSQNGFRAIRKEVFIRMNLAELHTTIEQEMTVQCFRIGARFMEVPAHEYCRAAGESKIQVFKHGWRYLYLLIKFMLQPNPNRSSQVDMRAIEDHYNKPWHQL